MKTTILTALLFLLLPLSALTQSTLKLEKVKASHRTIYSDIIIDASPEQVWEVLTDFESYPEWSYLFRKLEGDFKDQGEVTVWFDRKPGKNDKQMVMEHVLSVEEGASFSWSDVFAMGMKDHHVFKVEATNDGRTRFIQSDEAQGGMTWLAGGAVSKYESEHYPQFNQALKTEVEKRFKN